VAGKAPDEPATGSLQISVSGLPDAVKAVVTVSGPDGFSRDLVSSALLAELEPGEYAVSASAVTEGSTTYNPTVSASAVTVVTGGTAQAGIAYVAAGPGLTLRPEAVSLSVPFHGSRELSISISRTGGLSGLVTISATGLPAGVSAAPLVITEGMTTGTMRFHSGAATDAVNEAATVTLSATAGDARVEESVSLTVVPLVSSSADTIDTADAAYPGTLRDLLWNVPTSDAAPVTIGIDPVVFSAPVTITLAAGLAIGESLQLAGPVAADGSPRVTLDANGNTSVLAIKDKVNVTVSNLVLTGAVGRAAVINQGELHLQGSIIEGNRNDTGYGGGLFNAGKATVRDSEIRNNSAGNGGGIFNAEPAVLVVLGSTVSGNDALDHDLSGTYGHGGGLYNLGDATTENSTFTGNGAETNGGGVWGGSLATTRTTRLCTTVAGTTAGIHGGGVHAEGEVDARGMIAAGNTARVGNDIWGGSGGVKSRGYNLVGLGDALFTAEAADLVGIADARLGPLADHGGPTRTVALLEGSPARGAVKGTACLDRNDDHLTVDQRGLPRTGAGSAAGWCDIGAFEVQ
jgi:hypothetical protein